METCQKCGRRMVPMILSSFCPNDCDRASVPAASGPEALGGRLSVVVRFERSERVTYSSYTRWTKPGAPYRTVVLADSPDGIAGQHFLISGWSGGHGIGRGVIQLDPDGRAVVDGVEYRAIRHADDSCDIVRVS